MDKQLEEGRILVHGVNNNPTIKQRIAPIYPDERIQYGITLHQTTYDAFNAQDKEKSEASLASQNFNASQKLINDQLKRIRKIGRYFFKNEIELFTLLNLHLDIPGNFAEWQRFSQKTTQAIVDHEVIQTKMTIMEITPEVIAQLQTDINQIGQLKVVAEKEDGEAQQATASKQENFKLFMAYCKDLKECLELFFYGNEAQILEEVGIVVK
jgi:hypothetical protein